MAHKLNEFCTHFYQLNINENTTVGLLMNQYVDVELAAITFNTLSLNMPLIQTMSSDPNIVLAVFGGEINFIMFFSKRCKKTTLSVNKSLRLCGDYWRKSFDFDGFLTGTCMNSRSKSVLGGYRQPNSLFLVLLQKDGLLKLLAQSIFIQSDSVIAIVQTINILWSYMYSLAAMWMVTMVQPSTLSQFQFLQTAK